MQKENFGFIELPKEIEVTHSHNGLLIARQWASLPFAILQAVGVIVTGGFFMFFFCRPIITGVNLTEIEPQELILSSPCLSVFGVAIIGSAYHAIATILNKTFIRVNSTTLSIKHSPLPFWPLWRNKELKTSALVQLYCKKSSRSEGFYDVRALLKGGSDLKLLTYLNSDKQALFIEQEIEKYLGIEDKAVPGELG